MHASAVGPDTVLPSEGGKKPWLNGGLALAWLPLQGGEGQETLMRRKGTSCDGYKSGQPPLLSGGGPCKSGFRTAEICDVPGVAGKQIDSDCNQAVTSKNKETAADTEIFVYLASMTQPLPGMGTRLTAQKRLLSQFLCHRRRLQRLNQAAD